MSLGVEHVREAGAKYLGCCDENSARGASSRLFGLVETDLERPLSSILSNFRNVHRILKLMAGFANETNIKSNAAPTEQQIQEMMRGVSIDSAVCAQVEAEDHLNNFTNTIVTEEDNRKLKACASFWNGMVTEAKLDGDPQQNDIAGHIPDWSEGGATWILPTHSALEKEAFQPIIASLLRALSLIGNSSNRNTENSQQGVAAQPAPQTLQVSMTMEKMRPLTRPQQTRRRCLFDQVFDRNASSRQ